MKKIYLIIALSVLITLPNMSVAQQSGQIILRTGIVNYAPNLEEFLNTANVSSPNYRLLLFGSSPTDEIKKALRSNGVKFLEYVPNNAFIVKFTFINNLDFLRDKNIIGVYNLPRALKLDYRLLNWDIPQHAVANNNKVKVAIIAMNNLNIRDFSSELDQAEINIGQFGQDSRFAYCNVSKSQIDEIIKKPWVRSIELIDEPGKPESTEGRSLQKSNLINSHLTGGLQYDATGVKILVRDDGLVGPHIDYEGRLTNLTTDATGTHGDGVAGCIGAAGNIDPSVEGGASGADILVIDYQANFQDTTLGLHIYDSVMITNSSYSNGCNAGYTSTTRTVDKHIYDNQTLMHVFSAGNDNPNDCGYGAGNQWGNITGGHKMGKNVITVANLYNDASLVNSSSRGPAHDGRIKPDMAAHGQGQVSTDPNHQYSAFGGTSAAAPSLAGNLGQLLQAYRNLNNGNNPNSALLKAAAMNSATDLGNAGPDFRYGYGLINTARAYDVIANNQYLFSTISQNGSNTHTVNVPAGTGQLRIMLYWHDPEGTVNTNKALVNDLDMVVNGTLLPLVLDHTPNAATLNSPATPAVDHLNNVEQVVVNNPAVGAYTVQINGFQIPSGPQEYVLVYTFIEDNIKVTYPIGGESLIPGNSEIIHWDAYGNSGSFSVEYSTNNGTSWSNVGTAPGSERNISWTVPAINSGNALIRVSRATQTDVSDEAFNIFPVPSFNVQIHNITSVELNWASITGATKYYIWRLGNKYMEVIDSSTTNQYIIGGLQAGADLWLSVSASSATIKGQRANAKNFIFNPSGSCNGCISSISTFPYLESFEAGIGLFCQSAADDIDYTINSGGTNSNNTGPSAASHGTHYIYLEASNPNNPAKVGILGSPCYDLSTALSAQLKFDYHMYGGTIASLEIEVSTDGGLSWSSTPIWTRSGNQGNQWFTDSIDFSSYQTSKVSFRFIATTGSSAISDIAIDNIIFTAELNNLSVKNTHRTVNYSVKPNPSDGIFHLNTIENLESLQVLNSFGQVIKSYSINTPNAQTINLSDYASGVYFIILRDENSQYHRFKVSLL